MDGAGVTQWSIGDIALSRVPYFDIALPPESVGLTTADLVDHPLADPAWLDAEGQPIVGQAFWVVRTAGRTVVVDPCGASDAFLRTGPAAVDHQDRAFAALRAAGVEPEAVDALVLTHLDGIGMAALVTDDGWRPAFPNAPLVVTEPERRRIRERGATIDGAEAFEALAAQGVVTAVGPSHEVAPGVTLELTEGHTSGHAVVVIRSGGEEAILIGHLALTPLHLTLAAPALHEDVPRAVALVADGLATAHELGALVAGALWPAPGAVRVASVDPLMVVPDHGQALSRTPG